MVVGRLKTVRVLSRCADALDWIASAAACVGDAMILAKSIASLPPRVTSRSLRGVSRPA